MKTFKIMDLYFSAAPGPSDWYIKWERCGGNRQSPINIDTTRVRERKYRTLKIEFDNSGGLVAGDLENSGNYPTFSLLIRAKEQRDLKEVGLQTRTY